jgi:hypothetical protein
MTECGKHRAEKTRLSYEPPKTLLFGQVGEHTVEVRAVCRRVSRRQLGRWPCHRPRARGQRLPPRLGRRNAKVGDEVSCNDDIFNVDCALKCSSDGATLPLPRGEHSGLLVFPPAPRADGRGAKRSRILSGPVLSKRNRTCREGGVAVRLSHPDGWPVKLAGPVLNSWGFNLGGS